LDLQNAVIVDSKQVAKIKLKHSKHFFNVTQTKF